MIVKSSISELISQGEHQQLDFKMRIDSSKKIAKTLCAFANGIGGRILIGVKDNGNIFGIDVQEEAHMIEAAAEMYSKPTIEYNLIPHKIEGKNILEVWVPASKQLPHFALNEEENWIAYIRQEDETLPAKGFILAVWQYANSIKPEYYTHTEKEKRIFELLELHPKSPVNIIQKKISANRTSLFKTLAKLIAWGIIKYEILNGQILISLK
jgi:predicted HTH transcriptional regulator